MADTIFDQILRGEMRAWKVWEDADYLAFLTPFPNTPGATVVIPKANPGDNIFDLADDNYHGLLSASRTVANLLRLAFATPRVALVFEGTGVAYVHAKLYPLHGPLAGQTDVWSNHREFYPEYVGYLTTAEGPRMSDAELDRIQRRILGMRQ